MFFRIASIPSQAEVRAALEILELNNQWHDVEMGSTISSYGQPGSEVSATETSLNTSLPGLALAPAATGVSAEPAETVGVVVGVLGVSDSTGTGSAGLVGESTALTNDVIGIYGVSASAGGAAGVFENTAGGTILAGYGNGTQVFDVDGNGRCDGVRDPEWRG